MEERKFFERIPAFLLGQILEAFSFVSLRPLSTTGSFRHIAEGSHKFQTDDLMNRHTAFGCMHYAICFTFIIEKGLWNFLAAISLNQNKRELMKYSLKNVFSSLFAANFSQAKRKISFTELNDDGGAC